jgi:hypothetical protein
MISVASGPTVPNCQLNLLALHRLVWLGGELLQQMP